MWPGTYDIQLSPMGEQCIKYTLCYDMQHVVCSSNVLLNSLGSSTVWTGQTCSNLSTQTGWNWKVFVQSVETESELPTWKKESCQRSQSHLHGKRCQQSRSRQHRFPQISFSHKLDVSQTSPLRTVAENLLFNIDPFSQQTVFSSGHAGSLKVWKSSI